MKNETKPVCKETSSTMATIIDLFDNSPDTCDACGHLVPQGRHCTHCDQITVCDTCERPVTREDGCCETCDKCCNCEEFLCDCVCDVEEDSSDVDDSMDGDAESALASCGWGTDESYGSDFDNGGDW